MKKLALTVLFSGLFAWQASALIEFDFTFSGGGEVANGHLSGTYNGDGSYTITSGYFNGTAGGILGTYSIIPISATPPATAPSPSGGFDVDNHIYPHADPSLTINGLLFGAGPIEVGLWGGDSHYTPPAYNPGNYSLASYNTVTHTYEFLDYGPATFTLTELPETSSFAMAGVGLLALVYIGRSYAHKIKFAF